MITSKNDLVLNSTKEQKETLALLILFLCSGYLLPDSKISAMYILLAFSMWAVGVLYGIKAWKIKDRASNGTFLLITGIALSFTGHAIDQTLWSFTTLSSLHPEQQYSAAWAREHAQPAIIIGKGMAVFGALCHFRLVLIKPLPAASVRVLAFVFMAGWILLALGLS